MNIKKFGNLGSYSLSMLAKLPSSGGKTPERWLNSRDLQHNKNLIPK